MEVIVGLIGTNGYHDNRTIFNCKNMQIIPLYKNINNHFLGKIMTKIAQKFGSTNIKCRPFDGQTQIAEIVSTLGILVSLLSFSHPGKNSNESTAITDKTEILFINNIP